MFRVDMLVAGALVLGLGGTQATAPTDSTLYTDEEIMAKYNAINPSESDFKFSPPAQWSFNIARQAELNRVTPDESMPEAGLLQAEIRWSDLCVH